jgi:hypothetical protein
MDAQKLRFVFGSTIIIVSVKELEPSPLLELSTGKIRMLGRTVGSLSGWCKKVKGDLDFDANGPILLSCSLSK